MFLSPVKPVIFTITVSEIPALEELLFLPERYMSSKSTSYDSNILSSKTITKMMEHLVVVYSSIYTNVLLYVSGKFYMNEDIIKKT